MKEDKFNNSVLKGHLTGKSKEDLRKYRNTVLDAIAYHRTSVYTDDNGLEYQGSRFWYDALTYLNGKLKIKMADDEKFEMWLTKGSYPKGLPISTLRELFNAMDDEDK